MKKHDRGKTCTIRVQYVYKFEGKKISGHGRQAQHPDISLISGGDEGI
jgi:hypothetical protein